MTPRTLITCSQCGWHCDIPSSYAKQAIRDHRENFGHEVREVRYGRTSFGWTNKSMLTLSDHVQSFVEQRKAGLIVIAIILGLAAMVAWCQFVIYQGP